MNINPNDPRLTAYALGELDEKERVEIEAQVSQSEDLQRAVAEIRQIAELLTNELKAEPTTNLSDVQRLAIAAKAAEANGRARPARTKPTILRRWWIPTALAASLLIVVMLLPSLAARRGSRMSPEELSTLRSQRVRQFVYSWDSAEGRGKEQNAIRPGELLLWKRDRPERARNANGPGGWGIPVHPAQFENISYGYQVPLGPGDPDAAGCLPDGAFNTEAYDHIVENPFLLVTRNPLSTFSIDVDTASYANVRRFLNQGSLPPPGAVRIEEMINYFDYDYPLPTGDDPFSVNVEVAECPWEPDHLLARIALKGWELEDDERPPANLVFLLDVSGSMKPANKLPLLRKALSLLVQELWDDDRVAIVVYAGASGLVLPSTSCENRGTVLAALERLEAGGSTNGGAGIQLAYDTAEDNFIEDGINRVILATDGDFNVGTTNQGDLTRLIEDKAKSGVFLTVLGFGMGNYKDSTLEKLADKGNGNYAYIDTLNEARKVLVEQIGGTLVTIAKDVKIQIDFNPAEANAYRLIGYENRLLRAEDFNDDTKDAGEIGAGHTVTALYEIVPAGVDIDLPDVEPSKYQTPADTTPAADSGELLTVRLRYKEPDGDTSKLLKVPVTDTGLTLADASDDFVFQAAVASFGMLLRGSEHVGDFTYQAVFEMADASTADDPHGYRQEFLGLVQRATELQATRP